MATRKDLINAFKQRNLVKFAELVDIFKVNPNEKVKINDDRTIFETILSTANSAEYIKLCLKNDADFYMKNQNGLGQYPLHCVMESQCLENLLQIEHLLDESGLNAKLYSSQVNVKQKNGENSLHILARLITNENFDVIFEMMKILLSHGCNSNYPNSEDKTAFYLVLENLPKLVKRTEILNYFVRNADVDFYTYRSKDMLEMIGNENSNFVLPKRKDVNLSFESMKKFLDNYNINEFETLFKFFKASCLDSELYEDCCAAFMKISVKKSFINIVDLLIEFGADINRVEKNDKFNIPPSFLACVNAKPFLLNLFLSQVNIKLSYEDNFGNQQTLLHQFFRINKKPPHSSDFHRSDLQEFTKEQKKCFDLLMDHPKCDRSVINQNDENNCPAIYYAVRFKNDYATMKLLMKGAYSGTVIKLIRSSLLEEFLNSTITTNNRLYEDDENELKIDYAFLWPPNVQNRKTKKKHEVIHQTEVAICGTFDQYSKEVNPLQEMTEIAELQYLVVHPTIESFILLKWSRISFLIYINLIMILSFMVSFIPFAYLCLNLDETEKNSNFYYIFFRVTSFISISWMMIREMTQAMLSIKKYVCNHSNWIDICLICLATIFLLIETLLTPNWSRVLRTLVILLATAEYFSILGMVPIMSISIYTKMFHKVCKTFLKSLAFYSMLIVSFGFCFYNLQGDKFLRENQNPTQTSNIPPTNATRSERFNNFHTVGSSIIKSFIMFTGELETSYVNIEGWTYAIPFMLFVFLVTIVLYNLLNALAVSDTQEIKRDAKFIDLKQRISTMYENEEDIFKRNSKMGNWLKMVISLFPNTIPNGYVVVNPINCRLHVNNKDPITLTEWLPKQFEFFKQNAKLNPDILLDIQNLLKTRHEQQRIAEFRRLKESRNEKLANDIISMNGIITEIQKYITSLKNISN